MRYLLNKTELKTLNYILSLNENNQINEGLIDRVKNMAAKGLLTATVVASLMSNPVFAKEYKSLDANTKNKIEKLIKVDKTDHSSSSTHLGGGGGLAPDTLSVDFSSNFRSGEYKLSHSDLQQMNSKLQKIKDFVTNSNTKTFKIIIHSSESQVPSGYAKLELVKLRAEEALKVIIDYKTGGIFKKTIDPKQGETKWDPVEAKRIGVKKAINLPKYVNEQYVKVEIVAMQFDTPCNWNLSADGAVLTSATDYSVTTDFDVTDQLGEGDIVLSPGGIPDRVQVWVDGDLVGDSGYFIDDMTSKDLNIENFNYIPRYVAELTKVAHEKGMHAVKDSSQKKLITKTFTSFEELVDFMLTPEAKAKGYDATTAGKDTGNYVKILKDMWGKPGYKGYRTFTFYDKEPYLTNTKVKIKFKLDGNNKRVQIKIFSPLGQTHYECVGVCQP